MSEKYRRILKEAKSKYNNCCYEFEMEENKWKLPYVCFYCLKTIKGTRIKIALEKFDVRFHKECLDLIV